MAGQVVQEAAGRQAPVPIGGVAMTPVSWVPERDLEPTQWIENGRRLGVVGRNAKWWIGDWLRYGNAKWGERYTRAAKITGYDPQTLMNMVYVASRFDPDRRRETLSWSHHAALAGLEVPEQEELISRAEAQRLSVHDLRQVLRAERRGQRTRDPALGNGREVHRRALPSGEPVAPHGHDARTCPKCGHAVPAD